MDKKLSMGEYLKLTPGARSARRGAVAARPWSLDWDRQQALAIADFIAGNAMVRARLGSDDLQVEVGWSNDGRLVWSVGRSVTSDVQSGHD